MRRSEQVALGGEILERALHPVAGTASEAVSELITMAAGRRPPLEAAQSLLIDRLRRRSSDFDATRALCSVSAALSRLGWDMPVPTEQRRLLEKQARKRRRNA